MSHPATTTCTDAANQCVQGNIECCALVTVVALIIVAFGVRAARRAASAAIPTSQAGAMEAIASIQDWSKWMAAILTAALGALTLVFFDKDSWAPRHLEAQQTYLAVSAFLFLAAALACSSLVLCTLPAHGLQVRSVVSADSDRMARFDVYAQPLILGKPFIQLGDLLVLKHVYWFIGLALFVGVLYTQVRPDGLT